MLYSRNPRCVAVKAYGCRSLSENIHDAAVDMAWLLEVWTEPCRRPSRWRRDKANRSWLRLLVCL